MREMGLVQKSDNFGGKTDMRGENIFDSTVSRSVPTPTRAGLVMSPTANSRVAYHGTHFRRSTAHSRCLQSSLKTVTGKRHQYVFVQIFCFSSGLAWACLGR